MRRYIIAALILGVLGTAGAGLVSGSGRAAQETPDVTVDPTSVDFGEQVAQQASRPIRITVTNSGGASLYINSVTLGGDNAADFALAGDACTNKTVAVGKSCVLDIVMTPKETGPRSGQVTITCNAPGATRTIDLSGTGINSAAVPPG